MQRSVLAIGGTFLLVCACGSSTVQNETPDKGKAAEARITVAALEVLSGADGPTAPGAPQAHTLSGKFEIRQAEAGEQFVPAATIGGACLLAQIPRTPKACTASEQCDIPVGSTNPEFYGYCLGGSCWARPAAANNYCLKGVAEGSQLIAPVDTNPDTYNALSRIDPQSRGPVSWRVLGCLNGPINKQKGPPCAGGPTPSMHDEGPTRAIP